MPRPRSVRGRMIAGRAATDAVRQSDRQADRATSAARSLINDAHRGGHAMATGVEQHVQGLGTTQLRAVIMALFAALAEAYAKPVAPQKDNDNA